MTLARGRAAEVSGGQDVVRGPLSAYHHETYVFPLPDGDAEIGSGRWKVREPRPGLLWFDQRSFASEEQLLTALAGRVRRVPEIGDLGVQRFIEGETLGAGYQSGRAIPPALSGQIVDVFRDLVSVSPGVLGVERLCPPEDRTADGDTAGFLEQLIRYTEECVYGAHLDMFQDLFHSLGLEGDSFRHLRKHVAGLVERPFCLLHADLHRENFIVDGENRLWTIDWELAMIGDPLYDLATHLHLMRYPPHQERWMAEQWCTTVEGVRSGSSAGWERDLPRLVAYRRVQSVFTDIIRLGLSLDARRPDDLPLLLRGAAVKLRKLLAAAKQPLGLETVPSAGKISGRLRQWHREYEPRAQA